MRWLAENESPLSYLVLALAAALEYIFPPLPGDMIALFGTFLAASAGYHPALVYIALTVGAIAGSLVAYAFGRKIGRDEADWPRMLQGARTRRALHATIARFERHGAAYLIINRFLPALRSFFFVAAGMAGMDVKRVVLFGGISAALWNALILAAGYAVGDNWETLQRWFERYTAVALGLVGLAIAVVVARHLVARVRRAAARRARERRTPGRP
jgi:membrane-associated protein